MQSNNIVLENQPPAGAIVMAWGIFLLGPFAAFSPLHSREYIRSPIFQYWHMGVRELCACSTASGTFLMGCAACVWFVCRQYSDLTCLRL